MQRSFSQHEIPKDYLPTSFIAIDTEGQPPVEIAALAVKENHIIGVYHDLFTNLTKTPLTIIMQGRIFTVFHESSQLLAMDVGTTGGLLGEITIMDFP